MLDVREPCPTVALPRGWFWLGLAWPQSPQRTAARQPPRHACEHQTPKAAPQAYGKRGFGEVPGDATLDFDVELLSVKQDSRGYQVKLIEG